MPNLPLDARVEIYDTAGGPMRIYIIPDETEASVLTEEGTWRFKDYPPNRKEEARRLNIGFKAFLLIMKEDPHEKLAAMCHFMRFFLRHLRISVSSSRSIGLRLNYEENGSFSLLLMNLHLGNL